jgi:uncharacterized protein (TIGR02246 family)
MAAITPQPAPGTPEELSAAFARALARGEVEEALAMWVQDATILTAAGEALRGREAIAAALRGLLDNGTQVQIELSRTITAGDVAMGLGTLTLTGTAHDGQVFRQQSSSVVIYSRAAGGRWRIAIDAPWGLPES